MLFVFLTISKWMNVAVFLFFKPTQLKYGQINLDDSTWVIVVDICQIGEVWLLDSNKTTN